MMDNFLPTDFEPFYQLLISLGLGLLVGLQREWAESPLAGIRSFALTCLLGTISAILAASWGEWVIALGFSGALGMMLVGQFSLMRGPSEGKHRGLVSELSILIVFFIGVLVHTGPILLAASIAGLLAFVLQIKLELHNLAAKFDKNDIRSIMQFVLLLLVIFPIIPDRSFGPYDAINPHNIWLMVVLIVGISLVGYIIYKFFGQRAGVILSGFLGGLISSTATTITCSRQVKNVTNSAPHNALIILLAWSTLYPRVMLELLATAPSFQEVFLPLVIMILASLLPIFWLWRNVRMEREASIPNNPTQLRTAFTFALMYALVLLATSYFKDQFGNKGLMVVALLSGVVDVDAMTLSTGRHVTVGSLAPQEGRDVILTAIISNNFFKGLLTLMIGGKALFRLILIPWLISLGTGGVLLVF